MTGRRVSTLALTTGFERVFGLGIVLLRVTGRLMTGFDAAILNAVALRVIGFVICGNAFLGGDFFLGSSFLTSVGAGDVCFPMNY